MAGRLGQLTLDLIAKIGGFTGPMDKAKKHSKDFSDTLGGLAKAGGIAAGALVAFGAAIAVVIKTTADAGDELRDMALRTGVTVTALSELKHAAELSGASIEELEMGFRKLSAFMMNANQGASSAISTFDTLGIKFKDVFGHLRAADDVFMDAVDALNSLSSETEKVALAQELFGKSGTKLLPLIKEGKLGIAEMREEARKLGITFTELEANQADAFNDALDKASKAVVGLKNAIGKDLLPVFTGMLEGITNFIVNNPQFVESIHKVTGAFKGLADMLGLNVFSPLEKVNREIETMQEGSKALAFRIYGPKVGWNERLNELLAERVRLLALEAQEEGKAEREKRAAVAALAAQDAQDAADKAARLQDAKDKAALAAEPVLPMVDPAGRLDPLLEAWLNYLGEKGRLSEESDQWLLDAHLAQAEAMNAIDQERLLTASKVAGGTVDFANNMYTILGQKGKAFAQVAKGLAITQAVIDGKTAAVAAWAAGMKAQPQGWWSPIVAAGFTAASLAQTGALIASIGGSQGGGGGGLGGGGTVTTAPGGGFNSEYPSPTAIEARPIQSINIIIHTLTGQIDGKAQEEIVRAINEAGDRDVRINATAIAGAY